MDLEGYSEDADTDGGNNALKLFVLTLYRNCDRDADSYPLGVFSSKELAERAGRRECYDRGYKYGYEIACFELDHYDPEEDGPLDNIICPHGNPDWIAP